MNGNSTILLAVLLLSLVSGLPTPAQAELIQVNTVTASDYDAARARVPDYAIDGDLTTKWTTLSMPQWITLDLGSTYNINQTRMLSYTPSVGAGSVYTISASLDNLNWFNVIENATPNLSPAWTEPTFDVVLARYVRISLNSTNSSDYANVYEIEVYGQPNSIPVASPDTSSTEPNTAVNIAILANDSNLVNLPLVVSINAPPTNGQVVVEANNTITYIPNNNYTGTDSLLYEVVDNNGAIAIASVAVDVRCNACLTDILVTLTWTPNTDPILGYAVYYGSTQDTAIQLASDLPLTSGLLNPDTPRIQYNLGNDLGLDQGDGVCFRLKAYNESGFSDFSGAVCL